MTIAIRCWNAKTLADDMACIDGPVTVSIDNDSFNGGVATELFAAANIMRRHPHQTVAVLRGCPSLIAASGATSVVIEPGSYAFIGPLRACIAGTPDEMKAQADALEVMEKTHREALSRWPKVAALLDDGEDHFISANQFLELTE